MQQVDICTLNEYAGVPIEKGQLFDDVLFGSLLVLFFCFAIIYHNNIKQVIYICRNLFQVKERQSLPSFNSGGVLFFRSFMIFQMLLLVSIALFNVARLYNRIDSSISELQQLFILLGIFGILLVYYAFKQLLYFVVGRLFFEEQQYRLWENGYSAVQIVFGVTLYIPVLWLVFVQKHLDIAFILLLFLFILSRLVIFYKVIRIFNNKGSNILYLILYLCAQEILPLILLCEGLIYQYNFIETSTLWH